MTSIARTIIAAALLCAVALGCTPDEGMCTGIGTPCDAIPCCTGVCCVVTPDGGAGGALCYGSPPTGGSCF